MGLGDADLLSNKRGGGGVATVACSICLDAVTSGGDRSTAKLQCGHEFHLDCIGSAFNAKGVMQCPNCRKVEKGNWLYANGSRSLEFGMDEWTHDEDVYDINYSETPFGVHWCPFSRLEGMPSSFDEGESSQAIAFQDLLGYHAIFTENPAISSAAHRCPYLAYFQPLQPSSSSNPHVSSESPVDGPSHHHLWSQTPGPMDFQTPHAPPAVDLQYHGWEHLSPTFSHPSNRTTSASDQTAVPSPAWLDSDSLPRAGSLIHPFVPGHGPVSTAPSAFVSPLVPPYLGNSRVQPHVHEQHYQQQNPLGSRGTIFQGVRRLGGMRGLSSIGPAPLTPPDQTSYYLFPPTASSSRNLQDIENTGLSWERDMFTPFPLLPVECEAGWWRPFPQSTSMLDSSTPMGFWHHHGPERPSAQARTEGSSYRPAHLTRMRPFI